MMMMMMTSVLVSRIDFYVLKPVAVGIKVSIVNFSTSNSLP